MGITRVSSIDKLFNYPVTSSGSCRRDFRIFFGVLPTDPLHWCDIHTATIKRTFCVAYWVWGLDASQKQFLKKRKKKNEATFQSWQPEQEPKSIIGVIYSLRCTNLACSLIHLFLRVSLYLNTILLVNTYSFYYWSRYKVSPPIYFRAHALFSGQDLIIFWAMLRMFWFNLTREKSQIMKM